MVFLIISRVISLWNCPEKFSFAGAIYCNRFELSANELFEFELWWKMENETVNRTENESKLPVKGNILELFPFVFKSNVTHLERFFKISFLTCVGYFPDYSRTFLHFSLSFHAGELKFMRSQKSKPLLVLNGFIYSKKITYLNGNTNWRCADFLKHKCFASSITKDNRLVRSRHDHKHPPQLARIAGKALYPTEESLPLHWMSSQPKTENKILSLNLINISFNALCRVKSKA